MCGSTSQAFSVTKWLRLVLLLAVVSAWMPEHTGAASSPGSPALRARKLYVLPNGTGGSQTPPTL